MQIEIVIFVTEVWIAFYLNLTSSRIFFADFSCPSKLSSIPQGEVSRYK